VDRPNDNLARARAGKIKQDQFRLLLDIAAIAFGLADVALAAGITPGAKTALDADGDFWHGCEGIRFFAMNADEVTAQVVLAAEGTTTRAVSADIGLEAVGIMSRHMGL